MQLIGEPREFSTLRFEGSFSQVKQKGYFNFLNLTSTVANFYAYRESLNLLFPTTAINPTACIISNELINSFEFADFSIELPNETIAYNVLSVKFHGSEYKLADIVTFYRSGIVFHCIKKIIATYADKCFENCELDNLFFVCCRVNYQYKNNSNSYRILSFDNHLEIFRASQISCLKSITIVGENMLPLSVGRVPGLDRQL